MERKSAAATNCTLRVYRDNAAALPVYHRMGLTIEECKSDARSAMMRTALRTENPVMEWLLSAAYCGRFKAGPLAATDRFFKKRSADGGTLFWPLSTTEGSSASGLSALRRGAGLGNMAKRSLRFAAHGQQQISRELGIPSRKVPHKNAAYTFQLNVLRGAKKLHRRLGIAIKRHAKP